MCWHDLRMLRILTRYRLLLEPAARLHINQKSVPHYALSSRKSKQQKYRAPGRFWPVDLCSAVVRRKSASIRLVSMRSDTVLPQYNLRR
jgi:hypothetical protein